jgi:hypothetical protein
LGDLYSGGLIFGGGGLIFGMRGALVHVVGLYTGGGLYSAGGAYSRRFTVYTELIKYHDTESQSRDIQMVDLLVLPMIWRNGRKYRRPSPLFSA